MTSPPSALITGASHGIGLGIARRLAQQGYRLTIAARGADRLAELATQLGGLGAAAVHFAAGDVLDDSYLDDLVASHGDRYGGLDALIVNAGSGSVGEFGELHPKRFDKQIAINLRAAFVVMQRALPLLRATAAVNDAHGAKIIAMASITGIHAEPELAAYGAAKAGLISLCRSINLEESARGVQATAIAPGYVDTSMAEHKHGVLDAEEMIRVDDIVEIVDACLRLSRWAMVQEVVIARSGGSTPRA